MYSIGYHSNQAGKSSCTTSTTGSVVVGLAGGMGAAAVLGIRGLEERSCRVSSSSSSLPSFIDVGGSGGGQQQHKQWQHQQLFFRAATHAVVCNPHGSHEAWWRLATAYTSLLNFTLDEFDASAEQVGSGEWLVVGGLIGGWVGGWVDR